MPIDMKLPAALEPCVTCGHEPDQGKRLAYLAGCLDSHRVHVIFDPNWLRYTLAHVWEDDGHTYSATRIDHSDMSDDLAMAWLDDVHNNKTPRHERETGAAEVIFDPWIREGR